MEFLFAFFLIPSPCFFLTLFCQYLRDLARTLVAFISYANLLMFSYIVRAVRLNDVSWTVFGLVLENIFKAHLMFYPQFLVIP